MYNLERYYSDYQVETVALTIDTLRRIRHVAVEAGEPRNKLEFIRRILSKARNSLQYVDQQKCIDDAIQLADSAAKLLVSNILKQESQEQDQKWLEIWRGCDYYRQFSPQAKARSSVEMVTYGLMSKAMMLTVDPKSVLEFYFFQYNNLGYSTLNQFLARKVGVISPLASDYLHAATYRDFIRKGMNRQSFPLDLAVVSTDTKRVILSNSASADQLKEIAVFQDVISLGHTYSALTDAIVGAYPGKVVHLSDPNVVRHRRFDPSQKLLNNFPDLFN